MAQKSLKKSHIKNARDILHEPILFSQTIFVLFSNRFIFEKNKNKTEQRKNWNQSDDLIVFFFFRKLE